MDDTLSGCSSDDDLVGTDEYLSPEMLKKQESSYGTDLWALGVILYQMLTGETPFYRKNIEKTHQAIINCQFKIPDTMNVEAADLIRCLLQPDAEKRLGNGSIKDLKAHTFFASIDF